MSNEHAPTGGDGGTASRGRFAAETDGLSGEDLDRLFELLADGDRRRVLGYLDDADGDVAALPDLVDHVADARAGESIDRERVAATLHHNHLPKLAAVDVVEYDPRSETVRYRGGRVVAEWLSLARDHGADGG